MVGRAGQRARDLALASHPVPGLAVSVLAVLLAVSFGASTGTAVLVAVAAGSGQLTVGWLNDLLDVERDRAAGRSDKPLATGRLEPVVVRVAIGVAVVVTVPASLALGVAAGLLHLVLVAVGWSYDLGLKRTPASWLPYAVCFGLLPTVASLAAGQGAAAWWAGLAGVTIGVGAHLVNAVPDLEDDRRLGVVGLPHRLGARRSLDVATVLLVAGSLAVVLGPPGRSVLVGAATLAVVLVAVVVGRLVGGRAPFLAAVVVALVDAVALVARG